MTASSDSPPRRPRLLAALLRDDERAELAPLGETVAVFRERADLLVTLDRMKPATLLLPVVDGDGRTVGPLLRSVRRLVPRVVLWLRRGELETLQIPAKSLASVELLLLEDHGSLLAQVRATLLPDVAPPVDAAWLLARLMLRPSSRALAPLVVALRHTRPDARRPLTPHRLAALLACSHRTLNRKLEGAGLVTAADLCALAALAHRTAALEVGTLTTDTSRSEERRYSRALARIAGMGWREFVALGAEQRWRLLADAICR